MLLYSSTHDRHGNDHLSTTHQFSCCAHRLKRSRTSPQSPAALSQDLTVRHRRRTMRWICEPSSGVADELFVPLPL